MNEKRVFVDYEEFLVDFDKLGNELCGSQGFCLIKDNFIRKIYFKPRTIKYDLSKYKSSKNSFPLIYLYDVMEPDSEKAIGELMEYFPKESIKWTLNGNVEIDNLIKHYYEIMMEIRKYYQINMYDLCEPNLLYEEKTGFSIIDTANWTINEDDNNPINKERLNRSLSNVLYDDILGITPINITDLNIYCNLKKYGKLGLDLYKILFSSIMDDEHHFIEMLELYREIFKNGDLGPVKTIKDIENYTKILKKG